MSTSAYTSSFAWEHPSEIPFSREHRDGLAIADARRQLSLPRLAEEARNVAGGFAALGVRQGDVIATMLPNRSEIASVLFGAWLIGAAVTPINPALGTEEAGYQLSDSRARLAVVDERTGDVLAPANCRRLRVEELTALVGDPPCHSPSLDELALLIYTSGTTGKPKGVMLDHANLAAMLTMLVKHLRLTESDRALVALPLFHVNGLVVSLLSPLAVGGSTVILERFSKSSFWDDVARWRPTYFSLVPAMYLMFNAMAPEAQVDASSVRFCICGAAPVPPDALVRFRERFGVPIIEAYGLSETTVGVSINPLDGPQKPGSVGPPLDGLEVLIVDGDGNAVERGEPGEVAVRGPNVMRGYLGKAQETEEALARGWLHTGDVGYLDDDGYLFLVDRKKDMIIRGGENIYPTEVEHAMATHPAIQEVAVVGRQDPVMGELPVAFVALQEKTEATEEELLEHARGRLARYKVPVGVELVDALPRNAIGKVDKPELRQRLSMALHESPAARI